MASTRAQNGGGKEYQLDLNAVTFRVAGSDTPGEGANWFGPLAPPSTIAPTEVAGRKWDYPSGFNQVTTPRSYDPIDFQTMRNMADSYDILRLVIETRKDQVARMKWNIVPRDPKKQVKGAIKRRIEEIEKFFMRPDKDHFWDEWIRTILEDLLVLDAPSIYKRRTRGGDLYSLEYIDGATIKPVIDDWGRIPEAPEIGYQQVLKGFPAVDYTKDQLIYKPRNQRTNKVYGFSPVEQILMTISIALKRQVYQLNFFTEGNIPEALVGVPETWTPDQIQQFQDWFDGVLQGNLATRRRARFVPSAVGKTYIPTKETELFGKAEEWLARVVCFAFSINPQPFVNQMNRATAESASETAELEGLHPLLLWIKNFVDAIILDEFGYDDVHFAWDLDDEVDPVKRAGMINELCSAGLMTINEGRVRMGLDPHPEDIFNELMYKSSMGYVVIKNGYIPTTAQTASAAGSAGGRPPNQLPVGSNEEDDSEGQAEGEAGEEDLEAEEDANKAEGKQGLKKRLAAVAKAMAISTDTIDPDRPFCLDMEAKVQRLFEPFLRELGEEIADEVEEALSAILKADDDDPVEAIVAALVIDFDDLVDDLEALLEEVFSETGRAGLQLVIEDTVPNSMFNQVFDEAVTWSQSRVGELIGKAPDGVSLLDETTRRMIRDSITRGMAEAKSAEQIAEELRTSYAFSEERARTIAMTEVARANGYGALAGFKESGVDMGKSWLNKEGACPECDANAEQGVIELDEAFLSGDQAPVAHPKCRCVLVPEVKDDTEES